MKINNQVNQTIKIIPTLIFILLGASILGMYGAGSFAGKQLFNDEFTFFRRHLAHACSAIALFLMVFGLRANIILKFAPYLFFLSCLALLAVLIPEIGLEKKGVRRWLPGTFFSFQPSEFTKISTILCLAKMLKHKSTFQSFSKDIAPLWIVGITPCLLIVLGKDLSTATVLFLTQWHLLFLAGAPLKHFFKILSVALPLLYGLFHAVPHMRARIFDFTQKFVVPNAIGYQEKQTRKTLEGLPWFQFNPGPHTGPHIPELHTDFYFINILSETGLAFGLFILATLFFIACNLISSGKKLSNSSSSFFVQGMGILIFWQSTINLGGVLGLFPIAGIPLPFLSFGGNSLHSLMIGIGFSLSMCRTELVKQNG